MKKIDHIELTRSVVFFAIVWTVAQYMREQIFEHLEGYIEGAGEIGGLVFAFGLGTMKFYTWHRARRAEGIVATLWNLLPWIVGIVAPSVYVALYFTTNDSVGFIDWIALFTELLIPIGALVLAYVLLSTSLAPKK